MMRITIPERTRPPTGRTAQLVGEPTSPDEFQHALLAEGSGVHPKPIKPQAVKPTDKPPAIDALMAAMPAIPPPPALPTMPAIAVAVPPPTAIDAAPTATTPTAPTTPTAATPTAPTTPTAASPTTAAASPSADAGAIDLSALKLTAVAPPPWVPTPTPIEQAIQDLIAQLSPTRKPDKAARPDRESTAEPPAAPPIAVAPTAPTAPNAAPRGPMAPLHVAPVTEPRAIPEMIGSPSHLHLVLGDDAQRVVVTVAVRGAHVTTTLRSNDEQITAALSRNAGSLDDAMRARGLVLAELDTRSDRDGQRRSPPDREPAPEPRHHPDEHFTLEEPS